MKIALTPRSTTILREMRDKIGGSDEETIEKALDFFNQGRRRLIRTFGAEGVEVALYLELDRYEWEFSLDGHLYSNEFCTSESAAVEEARREVRWLRSHS
jgi:hypothetical protein